MESTLKKLEQNKYELSVEVGREELSGYIKLTQDRISKEVQLDGFRKGKAPKDLVRQKVGDQYILEEALDIALRDSLSKTIEKDKLEVLKVSGLNIKENSADKLVYTVKIAMFPLIKIGGLGKLKISRRDVSVNKNEINEVLDSLRTSRAQFIARDKTVDKGDRVEVDFEVTSGGLPVEGGVSKNHPLVVGDNKFIPGFEDQLLGLKPGEEKSFTLTAPKDYFHKSVAGKDLEFKVKVVVVQEIKKPELDDNFARTIGQFANITALENNIKEGILEEKKLKEKQKLRLEILDGLLKESKVELPKDLIEERLREMVVRFDNELHLKGMELSIYLSHLNKTEDDLKKDWQGEAEKQVAFTLLIKKIAKEKNLEPSPEEISGAADAMIQTMVMRGEANPENINMENVREAIANDLINEKVFDFLEKTCLA